MVPGQGNKEQVGIWKFRMLLPASFVPIGDGIADGMS